LEARLAGLSHEDAVVRAGVSVRACQSPRTVETSVVVMVNVWLILWGSCAGWGRLGLPAFPS
jgi:hypothetical protein